jgi:hypothetical protein
MRQMERGSDGGEPGPTVTRGRHRVEGRSAGHSSRVRGKVLGALMSSVIVVLTGIAWMTYHDVSTGITTTAALDGARPTSDYVDRLASTSDATTTSEAPSLTTVPATAGGNEAPTPTNLTLMTTGTVPCVR